MWCSPATVLLILAVIIVSGVRFNQGSCYSFSSSTFSFASSTSERVAAHKPDRESHVAFVAAVVVVVAVAVAVAVAVVLPAIAAAAVVAVAVSTHARAIVPTTCRVLDDSIRRVCWAHLLPASD